MLSPFTGTTMTLAHTGKGLLEDSAFFAADDREAVKQLSYSEEEFEAAVNLAITRLQVIDLNRSLMADPRFQHLNAFETELLPRLAEFVLLVTTAPDHDPVDVYDAAARVGFVRQQANLLVEMDSRSLAILIIQSQVALEKQQFAKDATPLLSKSSPSHERSPKDPPVFPTPKLARKALKARLSGQEPVNRVGSREK
jgi:hypothetical protein